MESQKTIMEFLEARKRGEKCGLADRLVNSAYDKEKGSQSSQAVPKTNESTFLNNYLMPCLSRASFHPLQGLYEPYVLNCVRHFTLSMSDNALLSNVGRAKII